MDAVADTTAASPGISQGFAVERTGCVPSLAVFSSCSCAFWPSRKRARRGDRGQPWKVPRRRSPACSSVEPPGKWLKPAGRGGSPRSAEEGGDSRLRVRASCRFARASRRGRPIQRPAEPDPRRSRNRSPGTAPVFVAVRARGRAGRSGAQLLRLHARPAAAYQVRAAHLRVGDDSRRPLPRLRTDWRSWAAAPRAGALAESDRVSGLFVWRPQLLVVPVTAPATCTTRAQIAQSRFWTPLEGTALWCPASAGHHAYQAGRGAQTRPVRSRIHGAR